jgi:hypothetical protein
VVVVDFLEAKLPSLIELELASSAEVGDSSVRETLTLSAV